MIIMHQLIKQTVLRNSCLNMQKSFRTVLDFLRPTTQSRTLSGNYIGRVTGKAIRCSV